MFGSCGASGDGSRSGTESSPEWTAYPYHRLKGGKVREFKLILITEKTTALLQSTNCELCRCTAADEDLLYPGYHKEWAYYYGPKAAAGKAGLPQGRVC